MRTLMLVSVLAALAACADSQTTAPARARSARASGDVAPSTQGIIVHDNKPQPTPTGFTTVSTVVSIDVDVPPGGAVAQKAFCPSGTTAISGGYAMGNLGNSDAPPHVSQDLPYVGYNGWFVRVDNTMTAAQDVTFHVYVLCIS